MKRLLLTLILVASLAIPGVALASNICIGQVCTSSEVGPFMAGISKSCGNVGTCTTGDIMQVFHNVGNWILGVIGAVVLLMYIYGGAMLLLGGASEDNVKKGKQALKISTIGLLIVFVAFAGIQTLFSALTEQGNQPEGEIEYVICGPGSVNAGEACAFNQICSEEGTCVTECEDSHPFTEGGEIWDCTDTSDPGAIYEAGSCQANLCPGNDAVQCCRIRSAAP